MELLVEIENNRVVRRIPLTKDRYTLGRGPDNDIIFDSPKVSGRHALLVRAGESYKLTDLGATNYVYVNGERVTQWTLATGDSIHLSRAVTLLFVAEQDARAAADTFVDRFWNTIDKKELLRLKEITGRIIALDSLEVILKTILAEAVQLVGAGRGFIGLVDEQGNLLAATVIYHNFGEQPLLSTAFPHATVRRAIREKIAISVPDTGKAGESLGQSVYDLQLGSLMCVPLEFAAKPIGVLYVDSGSQFTKFDEIGQFCLGVLADHAAIAIENAKLFDQLRSCNQRLEFQFQESEGRYSTLVHMLPDGVFLLAGEKVLFVNPAGVQLLGAESDLQIVGRTMQEFVRSDSDHSLFDFLANAAAGQQNYLRARLTRLDNRPVEAELTITGFGAAIFILIARDITDRCRAEAERLKTQKLEAIATLAGGLAHDFNNILTALFGNVSLARLALAKGDTRNLGALLANMEKSCLQAKTLTAPLLTFARSEQLVKSTFPISELLRGGAELVLRSSTVRADLVLPEDLWLVEADAGLIDQVIGNIVFNAVQAMPEGGIVRIEAENVNVEEDSQLPLIPERYVHVTISDTGEGMAPAILSKIFDPFFTTKRGGSGLGLAAAYSIMVRHRGAINVESEQGRGTIFHLYLPASGKDISQQATEV